MKYFVSLLVCLFLVSCKLNLTGKYVDNFDRTLTIKPNGKFTYSGKGHSVIGSYTYTGTWYQKEGILHLNTDQYLFKTTTNVVLNNHPNQDSIIIRVGLLPQYLRNRQDTTYISWLILLNDEEKIYETDENGRINLRKQVINKIKIRDTFLKFNMKPLVQIKDSIFHINNKIANDIDIYIADNESIPLVIAPPYNEYLIKDKNLFSIIDSLGNTYNQPFIRIEKESKSKN